MIGAPSWGKRMELTRAILFIAGALTIGFAVGSLIMWIRMRLRWQDEIRDARKQSVNQSRATLKGQIGEQLAPLLPGFVYAASDARFLGDPIDYIVFHGYTDLRDSADAASNEIEVVILDIKRGRSKLSASQQAVAEAVESGRVRFEVVRIRDDGSIVREGFACKGRR
jgi:predicted Holliday junction resolvase-like endonuclease